MLIVVSPFSVNKDIFLGTNTRLNLPRHGSNDKTTGSKNSTFRVRRWRRKEEAEPVSCCQPDPTITEGPTGLLSSHSSSPSEGLPHLPHPVPCLPTWLLSDWTGCFHPSFIYFETSFTASESPGPNWDQVRGRSLLFIRVHQQGRRLVLLLLLSFTFISDCGQQHRACARAGARAGPGCHSFSGAELLASSCLSSFSSSSACLRIAWETASNTRQRWPATHRRK